MSNRVFKCRWTSVLELAQHFLLPFFPVRCPDIMNNHSCTASPLRATSQAPTQWQKPAHLAWRQATNTAGSGARGWNSDATTPPWEEERDSSSHSLSAGDWVRKSRINMRGAPLVIPLLVGRAGLWKTSIYSFWDWLRKKIYPCNKNNTSNIYGVIEELKSKILYHNIKIRCVFRKYLKNLPDTTSGRKITLPF